MIPINIPREYAQFVSLICMLFGFYFMATGDRSFQFGVSLVGLSCWVLMMSESLLLQRVHNEMGSSLEKLRKSQELEVRGLISFLKEAKVASSPFETIAGATRLLKSIEYPAMIASMDHQIIEANSLFHELLGWDPVKMELNGKPVYIINDPVVMSALGAEASKFKQEETSSLITQYVYLHKSGEKIFGQLDVHRIQTEGFFCVFHPAQQCIFSSEEIKALTNRGA